MHLNAVGIADGFREANVVVCSGAARMVICSLDFEKRIEMWVSEVIGLTRAYRSIADPL